MPNRPQSNTPFCCTVGPVWNVSGYRPRNRWSPCRGGTVSPLMTTAIHLTVPNTSIIHMTWNNNQIMPLDQLCRHLYLSFVFSIMSSALHTCVNCAKFNRSILKHASTKRRPQGLSRLARYQVNPPESVLNS